ncbi:hypothetical protein AMTR_s00005p00210680 [Amborella trichopoda]|uniref:Uncharacterized protein n=1 Tax=Amborella trichopoda TaxID=13333 RepID=W1PGI5_AMBTC|nr:hypothetical protein AMTR_s00005p00210680 [Amborella trichopoda]
MYAQYRCSPPITGSTRATMTINSFAKGGDGGGPSECDNQYHDDDEMVVALSTGWYNHGSRCLNYMNISGNGITVKAKVVDECDSVYMAVTRITISNHLAPTTLWTPLRQFGRH